MTRIRWYCDGKLLDDTDYIEDIRSELPLCSVEMKLRLFIIKEKMKLSVLKTIKDKHKPIKK